MCWSSSIPEQCVQNVAVSLSGVRRTSQHPLTMCAEHCRIPKQCVQNITASSNDVCRTSQDSEPMCAWHHCIPERCAQKQQHHSVSPCHLRNSEEYLCYHMYNNCVMCTIIVVPDLYTCSIQLESYKDTHLHTQMHEGNTPRNLLYAFR